VEVQGTAEGEPFSRSQLEEILDVGWAGAKQVMSAQREIVGPRLETLGLTLPPGK
jgi:ribonuclease PH